jgi:Domain of unknown function (DUF4157)
MERQAATAVRSSPEPAKGQQRPGQTRRRSRDSPREAGGQPEWQLDDDDLDLTHLRLGPVGSWPLAFKLATLVGVPDSPLEREADTAAERALARRPVGPDRTAGSETPPVQRLCSACAGAAALGRSRDCSDCDGWVMRKAASGPETAAPGKNAASLETVLRGLEGRGTPLPEPVRIDFERRFGSDFSAVRIHLDLDAAGAARALGAIAFTHRNHIVFRDGTFDPVGTSGRRLLAHELYHTIQQGYASRPAGEKPAAGPAVSVQREPEEGSPGFLSSLVSEVSPELAAIAHGPVAWIAQKLEMGVKGAVGGLLSAPGLQPAVAGFRAKFDKAGELMARARKGGADGCAAFREILDSIHQLGAEIADSAFVRAVSDAFGTISGGIGKLLGIFASASFEALKSLLGGAWSLISSAASYVWSLVARVKSKLGSWWDKAAEWLGLSGADSEAGVWAWIKRYAQRAWDRIRSAAAPIIGPLTRAAKVFLAFTPLGPVYALITFGPQLIQVVAFLWAHRDDPDLVRKAHKDLKDTFFPALIDGLGNLRDLLGQATDWTIGLLGQLSQLVLEVVGAITGLPLLQGARSFVDSVREAVTSLASWGREALSDLVTGVAAAVKGAWKIVEPYKEVLGSIALAIVAPQTIPVILAGWAWKAIPPCYKPPIIDFLLDIAVGAIKALSGVVTFGPLWSLIKPVALGFLTKLKSAQDQVKIKVSDRIARIISGSSPDFLIGFVKGFFQGVWEGLTDPFKAIATVVDGLNWVKDLFAGAAARALGLTPPPPTFKISSVFEDSKEDEVEGGRSKPSDAAPALFKTGGPAGPSGPAVAAVSPGPTTAGAPSRTTTEAPSRTTTEAPSRTTTESAGPQPRSQPTAADSADPREAPPPADPAAVDIRPPKLPAAGALGTPPAPAAVATPPEAAGQDAGAEPQAGPAMGPTPAGDRPAINGALPIEPLQAPAHPPIPEGAETSEPDEAIASIASAAAADIGPDVSTAAGSFFPAISEYFSAKPSASFETLVGKLSEAWASAQAQLSAAGADLAQKVTEFFVSDQAEDKIGHATGWLTGTVAFQAALEAMTAGVWKPIDGALKAVARFINWPMEAMGAAFKVVSKLGSYLLDGLKALRNLIKEAGGGAIRTVLEALGSAAGKFVRYAEQLLGRFGRTASREAGAALERGGGHLVAGEAERLEERELAQAMRQTTGDAAAGRQAGAEAKAANEEAREAGALEKDTPVGPESETAPERGDAPDRQPEAQPAEEELAPEPGEEEPVSEHEERGEGDEASDEERKKLEHPVAIQMARALAKTLEAKGTPHELVPATLLTALKGRFRWIEEFQAKPIGPARFEIMLIASEEPVADYQDKPTAKGSKAAKGKAAASPSTTDPAALVPPKQMTKVARRKFSKAEIARRKNELAKAARTRAQAFIDRYPKLDRSAQTLDALAETYRRTLHGGRQYTSRAGRYLSVHTRASAAELRTIVEMSERADVVLIRAVPSSSKRRTPDFVIHILQKDGSILQERLEVRAITGAKRGWELAGSPGRTLSTAEDIAAAVRNKAIPTGKVSQLAQKLKEVAKGGRLAIHVPRGGPNAEASIQAAMSALSDDLKGAGHVHGVDFYLPGGRTVSYARTPGGKYLGPPLIPLTPTP